MQNKNKFSKILILLILAILLIFTKTFFLNSTFVENGRFRENYWISGISDKNESYKNCFDRFGDSKEKQIWIFYIYIEKVVQKISNFTSNT